MRGVKRDAVAEARCIELTLCSEGACILPTCVATSLHLLIPWEPTIVELLDRGAPASASISHLPAVERRASAACVIIAWVTYFFIFNFIFKFYFCFPFLRSTQPPETLAKTRSTLQHKPPRYYRHN